MDETWLLVANELRGVKEALKAIMPCMKCINFEPRLEAKHGEGLYHGCSCEQEAPVPGDDSGGQHGPQDAMDGQTPGSCAASGIPEKKARIK